MKKIFVIMLCILPMMAFAQEFGVFNRAEIFQAMPETQEAIKKLDQLAKNYEDDLLALREEYQKKGSEFVAQRDSMPELIRTRRMAEIQNLEERIQNYYQETQASLQKTEQELIVPINEKLMKAVEAVGDEQGLVYIFDISTPSALMYYSRSHSHSIALSPLLFKVYSAVFFARPRGETYILSIFSFSIRRDRSSASLFPFSVSESCS